MQQIFIHVGYPKCASSWLQSKVFVPMNGFDTPWPNMENKILERMAWTNKIRFDPSAVRMEFEDDWGRVANAQLAAVISHEVLVGDPVRRLYWGFEVAERLNQAFPEAKILICTREQKSFLYSAWGEYVRRGGLWDIETFAPLTEDSVGYKHICPDVFLYFDELVAHYRELYGADRVLCLPVELLELNAKEFLDQLASFTKNEAVRSVSVGRTYTSLGGATLEIKRLLNHFAPLDPLGRRSRSAKIMPWIYRLENRLPKKLQERRKQSAISKINDTIGQRFSVSNSRLQSYTNADLRHLGYPLA